MTPHFVHVGYAVGTGSAVMIPIRHMVITGQTQESGKTTTLEALIDRADGGRAKAERRFRAVTFVTKRGERAFGDGHQLQPYFRTQKADWQYVSSLIDVTMGEKNKLLRSFLMKTCRNTNTLAEVLANVRAAKDTAKGFPESIYTEIEGYLELVVPQLELLPPAHKLQLKAGLNVMDVSPYRPELQALVLRSVLDHVHDKEEDVVVVIPEAWEFLPEQRGSPVKAAAERLIRKGAGLGNYMWIDSQDLAGVWKTVVRACAVALVGVQREANEIKRTLANIHTAKKPRPADVASLELGEFYVCHGSQATKTYVQPAGMVHTMAIAIARGTAEKHVWRSAAPARPEPKAKRAAATADAAGFEPVGSILERVSRELQQPGDEVTFEVPDTGDVVDQVRRFVERGVRAQRAVDDELTAAMKRHTKGDDSEMTPQQEKKIDDLIGLVAKSVDVMSRVLDGRGPAAPPGDAPERPRLNEASDGELEQLAQQTADVVIERLEQMFAAGDKRVATLLEVLRRQPELRIKVVTRTIEASDEDLQGRLGILIHEGHFDEGATAYSAWVELNKRQWKHDRRTVERAVASLATQGFLRKEGREGYVVVPGMKKSVVKVPA